MFSFLKRCSARRSPSLIVLPLLLAPVHMPAQTPGDPASSGQTRRFTVDGVVLDSVTHAPIRRALVQMGEASALTGGDGRFSLPNVPESTSQIQATKPGYFDETFNGRDATPRMVQVGPSTGPVEIELAPEAIVAGAVTDAAGDPVEHASVQILSAAVNNGRRRWQVQGSTQTDGAGAFRIANLQRGTYILRLLPRLEHWEDASVAARSGGPVRGFPLLYFPNSPAVESAERLELSPGQTLRTDLVAPAQPFHRLSGTLQNGEGGSVTVRPAGDAADDVAFPMVDPPPGADFLVLVPSGTYTVDALVQGTVRQGGIGRFDRPQPAFARMTVAVGQRDVTGLHLAPEAARAIPVAVRLERTGHDPAQDGTGAARAPNRPLFDLHVLQVHLVAEDGGNGFMDGWSTERQKTPDAQLEIQGMVPGTYTAQFQTSNPWYVASATYEGVDALRSPVRVSAQATGAMHVVLRDDAGACEGAVKTASAQADARQDAAGSARDSVVPPMGPPVVVYAISAARPDAPPKATFSSEGRFRIDDLAPGDYTLVAYARSGELEYANPEAMQRVLQHGVHVTVAPGGTQTVDLQAVEGRP